LSVCRVCLLLALAQGLRASASPPEALDPVAACDRAVQAHPRDLASYRCYLDAARAGHRPAAERALASLAARSPPNPRAQLNLALLRDDVGMGGTLPLYQQAAAGFRAEGDADGEVYALTGIVADRCFDAYDCDGVAPVMKRAAEVARDSGRRDLQALVALWQAREAGTRDDVGLAERKFAETDALLGPDGPPWLRSRLLVTQGSFYLYTRRYREASAAYSALADLGAGDAFTRAVALGGVATAAVGRALVEDFPRSEAEAQVREALAAAEAVQLDIYGEFSGALQMRMLLGLLLGPTPEGIAELERSLAGREGRVGWTVPYQVLWLLAKYTVDSNPADAGKALRYAERALALARSRHTDWEVGFGELARSHVFWRTGERPQAIAAALLSLDALDRLRDRQPDPSVRARYATSTEVVYHLIAARLLDPAWGGGGPEEVRLAFQVMERLRARVLHDSLLAASGARPALPPELSARGTDIHTRIAQAQKRLLALSPSAAETARTLAELERAEADEAAWLDESARSRPRFRTVEGALPVTLQEVQASLAQDEALLAFQTWTREPSVDAPYTDGSSWVLGITRDSAQAFRIPDARQLAQTVQLFQALVQRRDASETEGAATLYRQLLVPVLHALPAGITRLVLVPDGPLHQLPFEALAAEAGGPPLAESFGVSLAPSAALWLHWRKSEPRQQTGALLALADPVAQSGRPALQPATAEWLRATPLGPLPQARSEAGAAVEALASGSRLLVGREASERFLKTADLRPFAVVHFATHAVVDTERPERSAVLLSPGAEDEDGLLQAREISALDFGGATVVLAACSSSAGQILRGEGMLSLGRSFFEAGAHAVVGNLWPVRDDESAAVMKAFYRHLAKGAAVGAALTAAKRERLHAGAPPAAWAGWVVLGDAALPAVSEAGVQARRARSAVQAATGVFAAVLALGWAGLHWRRRRRGR
jgi:CHAT domain-containing protein